MKQFYLYKIYVFLLLVVGFNMRATTRTAVASDTWGKATTWSPAGVPACGDTLIIPAGYTVTVDNSYDLASGACSTKNTCIIVKGTLYFLNHATIALSVGSAVYIEPGGTISAQNSGGGNIYMTFGGTKEWTGNDQGQTTNVSGVTSITSSGIALPIELLDFLAIPDGHKVDIKWATITETNNAYFTIEKSKDGTVFTKMIDVPGAGNSTTQKDYFETDYQPYDGTSYYRLKQTDYNGNYEYFNIIPVTFNGKNATLIKVYPNPVNSGEALNVEISGYKGQEVTVVLIDFQGREFFTKVIMVEDDTQKITLYETQSLPAGSYIITSSSNDKIHNSKVFIK